MGFDFAMVFEFLPIAAEGFDLLLSSWLLDLNERSYLATGGVEAGTGFLEDAALFFV